MHTTRAQWEQRFDDGKNFRWLGECERVLLAERTPAPDGGRTLDVGCGAGQPSDRAGEQPGSAHWSSARSCRNSSGRSRRMISSRLRSYGLCGTSDGLPPDGSVRPVRWCGSSGPVPLCGPAAADEASRGPGPARDRVRTALTCSPAGPGRLRGRRRLEPASPSSGAGQVSGTRSNQHGNYPDTFVRRNGGWRAVTAPGPFPTRAPLPHPLQAAVLPGWTSVIFYAAARKPAASGGDVFAAASRSPVLQPGVRWVVPRPTDGESRPSRMNPIEGVDPMEQPEIEQVTEELPEFGLMVDIGDDD